MKNEIKKVKFWEKTKNFKSQIQCFLEEKHMFYHERQNQKYGKMIKNDKKRLKEKIE